LSVTPGCRSANAASRRGKKIVAGADHRDVEFAAGAPLELRHRIVGFAEQFRDPPRIGQELVARRGELQLPAGALEQRQPRVPFERLDLRRDSGLRQVQIVRRAREAHPVGDRAENRELAKRRVPHALTITFLYAKDNKFKLSFMGNRA
jgi:hypothetical protein